jgi:prepilin-type N-terminal cleavage/methylation domain-containing protein
MNLMRRRTGPSKAGFTLIELLAVILIIGILATILITQLGAAEESAKMSSTRAKISMLHGVIDSYVNEFGGAPSSSFTAEQGVANDGTNVGIEALVVTLWSKGYEAGGLANDFVDNLVNTDADSSGKRLTDFDTRALLEICDDWGNPVAYISHRDYEITNRAYVTIDPLDGITELRSTPVALRDSTTGRYYEFRNFQLISAGPDALFGTEDDLPNFERD